MNMTPFPRRSHPIASTVVRTPLLRAIIALTVAICGTGFTAAQDWSINDEVIGATARGIVSDSAGNVYISGSINDPDGLMGGLILKSSDRGDTWDADPTTPNADPSLYVPSSSGYNPHFKAIAAARVQITPERLGDHIVAAGGSGSSWVVYRSVTAGVPGGWEQIASAANFNFLDYASAGVPQGVSIDALGNVYVVGNATRSITTTSKGKTTTTTELRGLTFKGSRSVDASGNETYSWSALPSDDFVGRAWAVACFGTDVFVAGSTGLFWEVRKSSDGGATWKSVDHFQLESGYESIAYGITVDPNLNRVIVCGYGSRKRPADLRNQNNMIVRIGTGVGNASFKTVDIFPGLVTSTRATAVSAAPDGSVYATGFASASGGTIVTWTTRRGVQSDGGWTWATDDKLFGFATDKYSQAYGISGTGVGDVFAIGSADGHGSWIVRRKLSPTIAP